MTTKVDDPAVRAYLATLTRLLDGVPDRALVVDGVSQHIQDALAGAPATPARVRAVLEELGDPAVIASEADSGQSPSVPPFLQRRGGAVLTVLLLTIGGLVIPVAGWIAGLGLLCFSKGWTVGDKLVGALTPLVLAALLAGLGFLAPAAIPSSHLALLIGFFVGSIAAAVFLLRRFRDGSSGGRRG